MAYDRIKGITIKIGGDTTELSRSLENVNRDLKNAQISLRDIDKLLKLDPTNVELLRQKQQYLNTAIDSTKEKLAKEKEALEQLKNSEGFDKNSEQAKALERQITADEQALKKLETQAKQFGSVGVQQFKAVGEKVQAVGQKMGQIGRSMTVRVTAPIVGAFTIASNSASDYEENLNKIDTAFGSHADTVKAWAETATEQFGLSKVAATEAASGFGALAKGIGLAEDVAAEVSIELSGLTSDLSSYFNVGTDESAKALEGIFTGEAEALKKFGVVMTETNLKQFAEDQGLVWQELDQTEKTMVRYQYVLEKTKDAQGDYARTSDGTANSLRTFKATVENLSTALGQQLLPIITPRIQKLTDIVNKFANLSPAMQEIIVKIGLVAAAIGPILLILGPILSGVGSIIKIIGVLKGAIIAAGGLVPALTALETACAPFLIGGAIIAGIIAAGYYVYNHWEELKQWATALKDWLTQKWTEIKTNVTNKITELKTQTTEKFEQRKNNVTSKVESIKSEVTNKFEAIRSAISDKINAAKDAVHNAIEAMKGFFNFHWELPHISLPHFSVSGSANPLDWLTEGVPHISVEWYRKAYDNPVMFTSPTVLQTAAGMKGFGDGSGAEIVMGLNKLRELVGSGGDNIEINVYGAQGQDVTALAYEVERVLVRAQKSRSAVFA